MALEPPLEEIGELLEEREREPGRAVEEAEDRAAEAFPEWRSILLSGFNILVYGLGSKTVLFRRFRHFLQNNHPGEMSVLAVRGLAAGLVAEEVVERARAVEGRLLAVVEEVEGPAWRAAPHALSALAERAVVLGSVSHVNAQLLWDGPVELGLGWVGRRVDTWRCYAEELRGGRVAVLGLGKAGAIRAHSAASLDSVWASLTPTAKSLFLCLVELWAEAVGEAGASASVPLAALQRAAKRAFCDKGLQHHLTEFTEHQLLSAKAGQDGDRAFGLRLPPNLLFPFLASHGHSFPDLPPQLQQFQGL